MLKSFAFHIICKCISKLHRRAAKNTRMTTFQLFKLSSPFQETFCNVEKCPKKSHFFTRKKNRVFPQKSTKAILARKFNVWFSEIEIFSPAKNLQLQFRREKFKYLISNFPQKSTVAVLANFDAQIQMRVIPNFVQFWRENSNSWFF